MLMMMIAAKGGSQNCDRIAKKFFVMKELSKNCDRIEKSFLIGKELSHNCDRIATKKLLGRNCHKIETELWKVFCREEIVTKLWQNCEKFFVVRKDSSTPITANVRWPHKVWWWLPSERKTKTTLKSKYFSDHFF